MTISTELLTHLAMGAAIALFGAHYFGWLRRPEKSPEAPPQTRVFQAQVEDGPVYGTSTNIPVDITVRPRYNKDS